MKMTVLILAVTVLAAGAAQANTAPEVLNVVATQRPYTALIDVTFDLADADGDTLHVTLWYSLDGGSSWDQECVTISGDAGPGISPASGLSVTWDAGTDVPSFADEQFTLRVYADDGGGTVPAGFTRVDAGSFAMGSPETEPGRDDDELEHMVTLTMPFVIQSTEVTNQQYADLAQWAYDNGYCTATSSSVNDALDGSSVELLDFEGFLSEISFSGGVFSVEAGKEDHPVFEVTWYGAAAYCDWLSLREGLPRAYDHATWECNGGDPYGASGYRLPTEAEWEYACRAGSTTAFANGPITNTQCDDPILDLIGWYCGNALDGTRPVGTLITNSWSLYDMHGNVWEWCNDWFSEFVGDETDPVGPPSGNLRIARGGSSANPAHENRSASRTYRAPSHSNQHWGFRPVKTDF